LGFFLPMGLEISSGGNRGGVGGSFLR
jgi:hypothetical protein